MEFVVYFVGQTWDEISLNQNVFCLRLQLTTNVRGSRVKHTYASNNLHLSNNWNPGAHTEVLPHVALRGLKTARN